MKPITRDDTVHGVEYVTLAEANAAREADREAMRMALASLRDGRDALQAQADAFHCAMRGYKPETHEAMDADVARADAAIKALEQRVGEA